MRGLEAEEVLQRALAIVRQDGRPTLSATTDVLDALAKLATSRDRGASAEALLAESLRCREQVLNADHPEIAYRSAAIADLQVALGRFAEAEGSLQRALAILTRRFGPDHLQLVGVLHRMSAVRLQRDDVDGSIRTLERAVEIADSTLGKDHPGLQTLLENLTRLFERAGRSAEADHCRARVQLLKQLRRPKAVVN